MKIKKLKFKQLLKLHLLKSRAYEHPIKKTNSNDLISANLDQILVGTKKALQVIFQYNQASKRILFVGFPAKLELKINLLTRHTAVPKSFDVQGIVSRKNFQAPLKKSLTSSVLKNYSKSFMSKLTKTPDLIILFDHDKGRTLISEAWVAKIPIIVFDTHQDLSDVSSKTFYVVNGNFKNILTTSDKNIFFIGLNFLFKSFKKKNTESFPGRVDANSNSSKKYMKGSGRKVNSL